MTTMSDYMPTTEEVRRKWHSYWNLSGNPEKRVEYEGQFDRWLQGVKDAEWARGYGEGYDDGRDSE